MKVGTRTEYFLQSSHEHVMKTVDVAVEDYEPLRLNSSDVAPEVVVKSFDLPFLLL